jgi:protocatechuate 3,4-dioxygenase beta subunit
MSAGRTAAWALGLALVAGVVWLSLDKSERPARAVAEVPDGGPSAPADVALSEAFLPPEEGRAPSPGPRPGEERPGEEKESKVGTDPRAALRVRVLRAGDEQPLAGARVSSAQGTTPVVRTTDEQGWCSLPVDRAGDCVGVSAEKEGFAHACGCFEVSNELMLTLAPTSTLFGHVFAADTGRIVPGARILLGDGCEHRESTTVLSRDDGSYELPGAVLQEAVIIVLAAEGFPEQYKLYEIRSPGLRVEVDLRLERGIEIQGRVVDFESGAGIQVARVEWIEADGRGEFRGRIVPQPGAARVELRVEAPGHCQLRCGFALEQLASPLELRLPRNAIVEGTVRDGAGQPIAGASVRFDADYRARMKAQQDGVQPERTPLADLPKGWRLEPEDDHCTALTDELGRYRIANALPWAQAFELRGFADGFESSARPVERGGGPGEVTRVDLVLEHGRREAYVNGELWLNGSSFRTANGRVKWVGPERNGEGVVHDGVFHLSVEPGEVAFRVEVEGVPTPLEGAQFTLQVERDAGIERRVELRTPTKALSGRVVFDDGGPAVGASVEASCALQGAGKNYRERLHVSTKTEEDGTYRLEVPDLGRAQRVQARLDNSEHVLDDIQPGTDGVDFVLARSGALQFRFREADGGALLLAREFALAWKPVGEVDYRPLYLDILLATDPDGWYEVRLPSGLVDLTAAERYPRAGYHTTFVEGLRIRPQEPLQVEFAMKRGLVVELRLAPDLQPLPPDHCLVLVESDAFDEVKYLRETNSWEGGRLGAAIVQRFVRFDERTATLRGLAPGLFRFKVFPDDLVIEPSEVVLAEKRSEPVLVRWVPR